MATLNDQSGSYMRVGLHLDGKSSVWLRIPTFWDDRRKHWIGAMQTPETRRLIHATGKDHIELQNSFNAQLAEMFETDMADEIFSMFKPEEYWEAREK